MKEILIQVGIQSASILLAIFLLFFLMQLMPKKKCGCNGSNEMTAAPAAGSDWTGIGGGWA